MSAEKNAFKQNKTKKTGYRKQTCFKKQQLFRKARIFLFSFEELIYYFARFALI